MKNPICRRAILFFDETASAREIERVLRREYIEDVRLFPLTSRRQPTRSVEEACRRAMGPSGTLTALHSAARIDHEVDAIRERVAEWSASLGISVVCGKTLREWLLLRQDAVSTWWFSLMAEKNTLKTAGFFQMAQLQACDRVFQEEAYQICVVSHSDRMLSRALLSLGKRHAVQSVAAASRKPEPVRVVPAWLWTALRALGGLAFTCWRACLAQTAPGAAGKAAAKGDETTVFVTYFPILDTAAAAKGEFRNRMTGPLQNALSTEDTAWICMYVPYEGRSYRDAVRLAAQFRSTGHRLYMLEEFITGRGVLRAGLRWLKQATVYFCVLRPRLRDGRLCRDFSVPESEPILERLLDESFAGWTGMAALLFLECFKRVFSRWRTAGRCIYYLEMHEWEKALNAARKRYAPSIKTIGFQHTHVTRNYFHYHCAPAEAGSGGATALPLPDVCACNGEIPLAHFAMCGLGNLRKVEAIRQLYLGPVLRQEVSVTQASVIKPGSGGKPVLLLIGTINVDETKGLVSFLQEAFPHGADFPVWLKGHPSLPMRPLLEELEIVLADQAGWEVREEPVPSLLAENPIVLVGASAVAIEALAYGCTVVVPVLPDCMFMSPLAGFEQYYIKAFSPEDLRRAVKRADPARPENSEPQDHDPREFVARYWCLEESLGLWKQLLA